MSGLRILLSDENYTKMMSRALVIFAAYHTGLLDSFDGIIRIMNNYDHHSQSRGETTFGQGTDGYSIDPSSNVESMHPDHPSHPIHEINNALQQDLHESPVDTKMKGERFGWVTS